MLIVYTLAVSEIADRNDRLDSLLVSLGQGKTESLDELYKLIKTDVFAFALSKVANKGDAEDISHDTFVQIYKNAALYKPMGKPMAWIITVELNVIRKFWGRRSVEASYDDAIEVESDHGEFQQSVINNEFLRQLLSLLSEEEREIISLHVVSGFKHKEIARILDKPLSTVLSKYNRAIKKLQLEVKEGGA